MELVECLRLGSSSNKAAICSGSKVGSVITGRALRLRAIQKSHEKPFTLKSEEIRRERFT